MGGGVMGGGVMGGSVMGGGVMSGGVMSGATGGDLMGGVEGGSGPSGGEGGAVKGCAVLPDWSPAQQRGVAYVTHYGDEQLIWYRAEGSTPPAEAGRLDMAGPAHDSALDSGRHVLAVAHDIQRSVSLYQLSDPDVSSVPAPVLTANLNLDPLTPRFLLIDPARARLYVIANEPVDEGLLTEMRLFTYDISDPSAPTELHTDPIAIPVTTAVALDPRAGVMFLLGFTDHKLYLYTVGGDEPQLAEGEPLDLVALYPEMNNTSMILRDIKVDPIRGRVLIARAQGANSELITFSYPPVSSTSEEGSCPELLDLSRWVRVDDIFDLSVPPADRTNLLSAHSVHPVVGEDLVFFVHDAWAESINRAASMVSAFVEGEAGPLSPTNGCEDFSGFGCFLRSHYQQQPGGYLSTEGASCLDQGRRVLAVASVDPSSESRGELFFFQQEQDGSMTRLLNAEGSTLAAGLHPVTMECD